MFEIDKIGFSERLQLVMAQKKMKQKDLASLLGVSENSMSAYKKGEAIPGTEKLASLSEELRVSLDWLLFGEGDMERGKGVAVIDPIAYRLEVTARLFSELGASKDETREALKLALKGAGA